MINHRSSVSPLFLDRSLPLPLMPSSQSQLWLVDHPTSLDDVASRFFFSLADSEKKSSQ
jgi:hypothetical protein